MQCCYISVIFFCKHKTEYEMRISDCSSDVCSSDLPRANHGAGSGGALNAAPDARHRLRSDAPVGGCRHRFARSAGSGAGRGSRSDAVRARQPRGSTGDRRKLCTTGRSEEHTSELQSLMRISYAVFCLKTKTTQTKKSKKL